MASNEQKVEQFAQQIIKIHGFRFNDGFSCLIPDTDKYPSNEGLFLWGFSQKRMRFETKVEKFHTTTRMKRMDEMLGLSEKEYKKVFTAVESYLKSLKGLGFEEIGKGVMLFERAKVYNVQADASMFTNNVAALKKFEEITLNNPVITFAEKQGYFKVQNRNKLAWDAVFGGPSATKSSAKSSSKASKSAAKSATKSTKATAAKKPVAKVTATKKPATKATAAKPVTTAAKKPVTKVATAKKSAAKATVAKKPVAKKATVAKKPVAKATAAKKPATNTKATAVKAPAAKATAAKKPITKATVAKKPTASKKAAPFGEKLKKLAGSQPISMIDDKTWNKQVNTLYKDVRSWLSEHQRSGHLAFNSQTIRLSDPSLGEYDIDSLDVHLAGDLQVVFQPIEMNMPGAAGRVDLYNRGSNTRKVMLLLVNTRGNNFQWEIWKGLNDKGQIFDRNALEALLTDWIES